MSYTISTKKSWDETMRDLKYEFQKWGIGLGDWDVAKPNRYESSVTVSYKKNGKLVVLKYDRQYTAKDNLRAIFLAIQDMRMIEVRGVGDLVASAYKQLGSGDGGLPPTTTIVNEKDPYQVLGVTPGAEMPVIEAAYRAKARLVHPDVGGTSYEMTVLNEALRKIRVERGIA